MQPTVATQVLNPDLIVMDLMYSNLHLPLDI